MAEIEQERNSQDEEDIDDTNTIIDLTLETDEEVPDIVDERGYRPTIIPQYYFQQLVKEIFYKEFPAANPTIAAASIPPSSSDNADHHSTTTLSATDNSTSSTSAGQAWVGGSDTSDPTSNHFYGEETGHGVKWQSSAIQAIQEGAEAFAIGLFQDANDVANRRMRASNSNSVDENEDIVPIVTVEDIREALRERMQPLHGSVDASDLTTR